MAALAEILAARGASLSGADVAESFPTQEILDRLGLRPGVGFAGRRPACRHPLGDPLRRLRPRRQSASCSPPRRAASRCPAYPEALGELSRSARSVAISGVHGKTTTRRPCAGCWWLRCASRRRVLTATRGGQLRRPRHADRRYPDYLIAETCEYRNHFAHFAPSHAVVTAVELEHVDAFPTHSRAWQPLVHCVRRFAAAGEAP